MISIETLLQAIIVLLLASLPVAMAIGFMKALFWNVGLWKFRRRLSSEYPAISSSIPPLFDNPFRVFPRLNKVKLPF